MSYECFESCEANQKASLSDQQHRQRRACEGRGTGREHTNRLKLNGEAWGKLCLR